MHVQKNFSLKLALENDVICQKRGGKAKQFVILRDDKVYKGPFTAYKLGNIRSRNAYFRKWNTPLMVLPDMNIDDLDMYTSESGPFITYPNLAKGYPIECEMHQEGFSTLKYKVLKRTGLIKLNDALEDPANDWAYDQIHDLILAHLHSYLLSVGDRGLYNILADVQKRQLWIIDYDETRTKDTDDEFFYFTRAPNKEVATKWIQFGRPLYSRLIEELRPLLKSDPDLAPRINMAIDLLARHGKISAKPTKPLAPQPVTENKCGKMRWGGLFKGSFTYSGYELDVMKSALQKYIRRNNCDKALKSAFELHRMVEIGGKAAQTNMYNRLAIICAEDIGPANLSLVIRILDLLYVDAREPAELAAVVQLLCESEKTRIMSHIWRVYASPEGREMAVKKKLQIDTELRPDDTEYIIQRKSPYWKPSDPEAVQPYAEMFLKRMQEKDYNAVAWLYYYQEHTKDIKLVPRNRRTDPMVVIWEMLGTSKGPTPGLLLPVKVADTLARSYFEYSEKRPFLMMAITAALFGTKYEEIELTPIINAWKYGGPNKDTHPVLTNLLTGNYTFEIDDYVLDKHTAEGRKRGAGRKEFVNEGAHVENQSPIYYSQVFADIYLES